MMRLLHKSTGIKSIGEFDLDPATLVFQHLALMLLHIAREMPCLGRQFQFILHHLIQKVANALPLRTAPDPFPPGQFHIPVPACLVHFSRLVSAPADIRPAYIV